MEFVLCLYPTQQSVLRVILIPEKLHHSSEAVSLRRVNVYSFLYFGRDIISIYIYTLCYIIAIDVPPSLTIRSCRLERASSDGVRLTQTYALFTLCGCL